MFIICLIITICYQKHKKALEEEKLRQLKEKNKEAGHKDAKDQELDSSRQLKGSVRNREAIPQKAGSLSLSKFIDQSSTKKTDNCSPVHTISPFLKRKLISEAVGTPKEFDLLPVNHVMGSGGFSLAVMVR